MNDLAAIYLERGRAFLDAADTLFEAKQSTLESYHPLATLLLFSIEISLKAALHSAGATVKNGHEIDRYLIQAISSGLLVSKEVAAGVFTVAEPYRLHGPRYAPLSKTTISMPPISLMRATAHSILDRCIAMIDGERHQTVFVPLTRTAAEELITRVATAYQAQIAAFDPRKVYDEASTPDIPLGTTTITPLIRR